MCEPKVVSIFSAHVFAFIVMLMTIGHTHTSSPIVAANGDISIATANHTDNVFA